MDGSMGCNEVFMMAMEWHAGMKSQICVLEDARRQAYHTMVARC